ALCRRNNLRDHQATLGYGAAATAPLKSENRSRSLNNLSQVSRKRSKAPLLFRSRTGRRPRALAKARADLGPTHWNLNPWPKVGSAQSNQRAASGVTRGVGSDRWMEYLEERTSPPSGEQRNRRFAV